MKPAPIGLLPFFEITDIADYGLTWNFMEINGKIPHFYIFFSIYFFIRFFFLYIVIEFKFSSIYRIRQQVFQNKVINYF